MMVAAIAMAVTMAPSASSMAQFSQVPEEIVGPIPLPVGPPLPNPNPSILVSYIYYTKDNAPSFMDQGVSVSSCSQPGNAVCAFAMADTHREKVNNSPNLGVASAAGHGQSNEPLLGGTAVVSTTLDSDNCDFLPGQGCGFLWSDISNSSDCKYSTVQSKTTATLDAPLVSIINIDTFSAVAVAVDSVCETT